MVDLEYKDLMEQNEEYIELVETYNTRDINLITDKILKGETTY